MDISSVGGLSAPVPTAKAASSEASEGPGPDKVNDHDADDLPAAKAPTAAGTGTQIEITA